MSPANYRGVTVLVTPCRIQFWTRHIKNKSN
nr:MAG TPA_asm: hypothetical protein [Caudoviricetes sp.]